MVSLPPRHPPPRVASAQKGQHGSLGKGDKKWGEPELQGIETTKAGESLKGANPRMSLMDKRGTRKMM